MIKYIICQRYIPKQFTREWLLVWGKRIFNIVPLSIILLRAFIFRVKGVSISGLSYLGNIELKGNPARLAISEGAALGNEVVIALHDKVSIGSHVVINDQVIILTGSHCVKDRTWPLITKPVVIESYAWISTRATILPGVVVGEGAVVAAGAVVAKNVEPYTVVAGNPAIKIGERVMNLDYKPVNLCAPFEAWFNNKDKD